MKAYSEYKDSGIDWIGKIPKNWQVKKLKFNTYIKGRIGWQALKTGEFVDEGPYCVTGTDFKEGKINWDTCYHVGEERWAMDKFIQLKEKDLVITKDGTIGKIAIVENLNGKACLNSGVFVTRPTTEEYLTEYMYWVLNSAVFNEFINFEKKGTTISHLYQNVFENLPYPNPTIKEQERIVYFLNDKVSKINDLVKNKYNLINFLKEQRLTLINHTVTIGLDKNIELKNTGIEWMSKIPLKWELRKLSRSFNKISSGTTPTSSEEKYYKNGSINWVNTGDLNDSNLFIIKKKITQEAFNDYSTLKMYPADTLLIAMYGATIGKVSILKIEATTNQACCALSDSPYFDINYVYFWVLSNREYIINMSYGGGQPNISQDIIKSLKLPQPPISEQKEIVKFLDQETSQIDKSVEKIQKEIELLEEYKEALISEAVTGKIKVTHE